MSSTRKDKNILPKGTILDDRFEVIDFLGAGCFGAVYRAEQLAFGKAFREVALKLFDADKVNRQNMREVFNDALSVMGMQENQPDPEVARRIVPVYDIGVIRQPPERAYISMKMIGDGRTLDSQIIRHRPHGMPVDTSLKYLRELLIPLAWMHAIEGENGVVHGDLKPDNVLLTEKFELVLADFGVAARLSVGSVGGAISYQAPETLLGVGAEAPSDVYGVGLIWYEMLTSRHPFENVGLDALGRKDTHGYIRAHQEARLWPIRTSKPGDDSPRIVPASEINHELAEKPQVELMLNRCLAYRQSDRYTNAGGLLNDLNRHEAGESPVAVSAPLPPPPQVVAAATAKSLLTEAQSHLLLGRTNEAVASAEAAVRADSRSLNAFEALVKAYSAARQFDKAQAAWRQAQQIAPGHKQLFLIAAEMYAAIGKPSMAQAMRQQAAAAGRNEDVS